MDSFRSVLRGMHVASRVFQGVVDLGVWLFILVLMAYLLRQPDVWLSSNDIA